MKRLFFPLFTSLLLAVQSPALEWEMISSFPTLANLQAAYGNGVFVTVGDGAFLYSSDSGQTWLRGSAVAPAQGTITDLAFGDGVFVATTSAGEALTSTDGKIWTPHSVMSAQIDAISFGNGLFFAGGQDGTIATSTNGVVWNLITGVSTQPLVSSAYGGGRFVMAEYHAPGGGVLVPPFYVITSPDGATWTRSVANGVEPRVCSFGSVDCSEGSFLSGLTFGNGKFLARVTYHGSPQFIVKGYRFYSSSDGVNWTAVSTTTPPGPGTSLEFVDGKFVSDGGAAIYSSIDGATWTAHDTPANPEELLIQSVVFGGDVYVAAGASGLLERGASLDALLRLDNLEKSIDLVGVAVHGDTVVGVANLGHRVNSLALAALIVSTNGGKNFAKIPLPGPGTLFSTVRYENQMFVAVGRQGAIWHSNDGLTWDVSTPVTASDLMDVKYAEGMWLAVGKTGTILTSTDGANFTLRNSGADVDLYGVAGGNGVFVAVGASGAILKSANGQNWSLSGTDEGSTLWDVTFGGGRFVAVGENGRVYYSTDGTSWTMKRIIGAALLGRVSFADGQYVTIDAGTENSYFSIDGSTWTQSKVPGVSLQSTDASEGKHYLSGANSTVLRQKPDILRLAASIGPDNRFTLEWDAPVPANFRVYAATEPDGTWALQTVLNSASGHIQWKDPNSVSGARFYIVGRE